MRNMNSVWFIFLLFLLFILNGNFVNGDQGKQGNFGGIIARDCNMIRPSFNEPCKAKEVVPILARQYYRLYYFKLTCNAINLGGNLIAAPSICFESGIPAPGEYVAVSTSRNWCYNAPEHVAVDYTIVVRNGVGVTFAHLIPPLANPCRPNAISEEKQPEMVKGFDWRSRKTFQQGESYDGCIKHLPSALLYNRPNTFWGFQHPYCKDPIRFRDFYTEFIESNVTMMMVDMPVVSEKAPIKPNQESPITMPVEEIPTTSTEPSEITDSIDQLEVSQKDIENLNHDVEDLKNKLEEDEQKIHELEHSIDQSIKDNKQIKNTIEDIRDQEVDDERWIEDLEKNFSKNDEKLKELENIIEHTNQNELDHNEMMEDLKGRLVEDEKKMDELEHSLQDVEDLKQQINKEENKIEKLEDAVEATNQDAKEEINKIKDGIVQLSNETAKNLNDTIENLKEKIDADEQMIEKLEEAIDSTIQNNTKLKETIDNMNELLQETSQKIDELENIAQYSDEIKKQINDTVENLKAEVDDSQQTIQRLEDAVNATSEHNNKLDTTIEDLKEEVNNKTKNIESVKLEVESNITHNWVKAIDEIIDMIEEERKQDEARNEIITELIKNVTAIENDECSKEECQNFDKKLNDYIVNNEKFKQKVNILLQNKDEELEQCKDFMRSTEKKMGHLEQVVHELMEKFSDHLST